MQYCDDCQKAIASIHIMDLRNGSVVGHQHFCVACAESAGVVQPKTPIKFSTTEILEDLLGGLKSPSRDKKGGEDEPGCPGCGMTASDFKMRGRLGCPRCYEVFRSSLLPLLERVHDGTSHRGRFPGRTAIDLAGSDTLTDLRRRLENAIQEENYEEAAQIRDELQQAERAGDKVEE